MNLKKLLALARTHPGHRMVTHKVRKLLNNAGAPREWGPLLFIDYYREQEHPFDLLSPSSHMHRFYRDRIVPCFTGVPSYSAMLNEAHENTMRTWYS